MSTSVNGQWHFRRAALGAMVVVLSGLFMSVLDFFIVNIALPSIQGSLHASPAAIQFIVAAYALAFGSALITGGRLGDIFGRRRLLPCPYACSP